MAARNCRKSQPYRVDWHTPAKDVNELNHRLGKLWTDADEMFQQLYELSKCIDDEIIIIQNNLSTAGLSGHCGSCPPGMDGLDGEDGALGPQGPPGSPGPIGSAGPSGLAGPAGEIGLDGDDGIDGFSVPGPQGSIGTTGSTGPSGMAGPPGPGGLSGDDGFDGIPIQGPQGPTGATGATGPSGGPTGSPGPPGYDGLDGDDGFDGFPGIKGLTGATGAAGSAASAQLGPTRFGGYIWDGTGAVTYNLNTVTVAVNGTQGTFTDSAGFWWRTTTASGTGKVVDFNTARTIVRGDTDPYLRYYIRTGAAIGAIRIWAGAFITTPRANDTLTATTDKGFGFRYASVAGDGGWVGVATNAAGTTEQVTGTVATIAANTEYLLEITVSSNGGSMAFSVNGSAAQTLDTSASPIIAPLIPWLTATTLESVDKTLDSKSFYFSSR